MRKSYYAEQCNERSHSWENKRRAQELKHVIFSTKVVVAAGESSNGSCTNRSCRVVGVVVVVVRDAAKVALAFSYNLRGNGKNDISKNKENHKNSPDHYPKKTGVKAASF